MAWRVIPSSVEHLKCPSNVIIPALRKIPVCKVYIIHEIHILLIKKESASHMVCYMMNVPDLDNLFRRQFQTLILTWTFKDFNATFIVSNKSWIKRTHINLSVSIHIIIHSRSPLNSHTRSEAVIPGAHSWIQFRSTLRISPMHGKTCPKIQSVYNFYVMRQIYIYILEIIQIKPIKRECTVRHSRKLVKHNTTVNSVTVSHVQLPGTMFSWIINILNVRLGIQFLLRKIETYLRSYSQQTPVIKQFVVFINLPVGYTIAMTVTKQQRIDNRRTVNASHLGQVYIVRVYQSITHLSQKDLAFRSFQVLNRIFYPFLSVQHLTVHLILVEQLFFVSERKRS